MTSGSLNASKNIFMPFPLKN